MTNLKPFSEIKPDVGCDDVVMLRLEEISGYVNFHPVGYVWDESPIHPLTIYPTSGFATAHGKIFLEITNRGVDISEGIYLGKKILGYEVLRRGKSEE